MVGARRYRQELSDHMRASETEIAEPALPTDLNLEICAQGIHKSFGDHVVLRDVSFDIRRGEMVAIVGGSGCGKTVLLDTITGLIEPNQGRVLVTNHAVAARPLVNLYALNDESLDALRLHWAVVFQRNALFTGTVLDNIALWMQEHTQMTDAQIRRRVEESLAAVALDVKDVLPKERESLSGGMAKRVAIARAIAVDPIVIFYDEPTTGLDPVISGHIHELIWNLHHRSREDGQARTTVIVTHDKELLRRLQPRVLMLDNGGVCFDGSYEQFQVSDNPVARQYLLAMPVLHKRPADERPPTRHPRGFEPQNDEQ